MASAQGSGLSEARLEAVLRLIPPIQLFSLVDAVLLSWYFWGDVSPWFLGSWTAAVAVHGLIWLVFSRSMKRRPAGSSGMHRWMLVHAVTEGLLFSTFFVVVFPAILPAKAVVLGAFAAGLLAAGALSKMSLRAAAWLFLATLTLGAGVGFGLSSIPSPWIPEILLAAFAVALSILVNGMSDVFDARVEAEQALGREKALVSDLLEDFGASASEGLWEVDPKGNLTYVSPRLAELFQSSVTALLGHPLAPGSEWALTWTRTTPFRNLEVPIDGPEGRRWWSLTAKPLRTEGVVSGWRGVASDVTEARKRELEVLRMSQHDGLTDMLNRRAFRALLEDLFTNGRSPGHRCLILIDLADFKEVNETRGHAFGDALLVAIADRIRAAVPENLVLARLDGNEFAIQGEVIESEEHTKGQVESLLHHLVEPYQIQGDRFDAGFRIGLSFLPNDADSADQWLRTTDLALRTAKGRGRNRIQAYDPSMMVSFTARSALKAALRGAPERGEFFLEYQPIVRLSTGTITGFEALARWNSPSLGPVSPTVFIPLAEETEVILGLGLRILEEACRTALAWPDSISVSVNVSGVQLRSGTLADDVLETLARTGLDPRRLVLEVTESALVREDHNLIRTFQSLKSRGIRWALDDFGTGYSSLSYLQDFPFDKLKIDQAFVRPPSARAPSPALLSAIVSLARALGLTTTAEGIEDEAHRELLHSLGCDKGQGYFFSRAVPSHQIPELLGMVFGRNLDDTGARGKR